MTEIFTGSMSLKRGITKDDKGVVYFNKASAKLGNVFLADQRNEMVAAAIEFAKSNKLLLNVNGKKIGLGNYHSPADLAKLVKVHEIVAFNGFKGSVYLCLMPNGEDAKAATKAVKPADLAPGAIKL